MGNQNEMELDLLELFYYLKRKIWMIVASFVLCGVIGFTVSSFLIAPRYTASTRMYVLNRTNETNVVYADIQISSYLLNDYKVLITGRNVTQEVIRRLNLSQKPERLAAQIDVTSPTNTRVLQINVTDTDAQLAADIANCVREVASEQIQEIMDVDAVKLVYAADVPEKPSSPNVRNNTIFAAAFGLFVSVFFLVVMFMMDDTIRTEEDVQRYLNLGTLGVIPKSSELDIQQGAKFTTKAKRRGAR